MKWVGWKKYLERSWPAWAVIVSVATLFLWQHFSENQPVPKIFRIALTIIVMGSFAVMFFRARKMKVEDMPAADRKVVKKIVMGSVVAVVLFALGATYFGMNGEFGSDQWFGLLGGMVIFVLFFWWRIRKW